MSEQEQKLPQVDWRRWITRWDAMQAAYLPYREERFTIMLDVVEQVIGESFVALGQAGNDATNDATNDAAGETTNSVDRASPIGDVHEAALRDAGFREVGLIWRTFDDGILLGVR
jgi:hypothetical protein